MCGTTSSSSEWRRVGKRFAKLQSDKTSDYEAKSVVCLLVARSNF